MSRTFGIAVAIPLALFIACTSHPSAPTSPSTIVGGPSGAAADGSTLKTTAPAPVSPVNGVKVTDTAVVLVVTNATPMFTSNVALSYRFELQNAAGTVVESQLVAGGVSTTSRTVAAPLDGEVTYRWRARAEFQGAVGPWSALQSFVSPVAGYNRPGALYDPLTSGTTAIGSPFGLYTWIPGQGIRFDEEYAYVSYKLPASYPSGEISIEATGVGPDGAPGKARMMSLQDRFAGASSSAKHSINVQYRGAGGDPSNTITFKAILGDNAHSVEAANRFNNIYILDPSKVYLFTASWTPTSVRVTVRQGGATGSVVYDELATATSGTTDWSPQDAVYAFVGTNNANYTGFDGSRVGAIFRNLWVGSTPRPSNIP